MCWQLLFFGHIFFGRSENRYADFTHQNTGPEHGECARTPEKDVLKDGEMLLLSIPPKKTTKTQGKGGACTLRTPWWRKGRIAGLVPAHNAGPKMELNPKKKTVWNLPCNLILGGTEHIPGK